MEVAHPAVGGESLRLQIREIPTLPGVENGEDRRIGRFHVIGRRLSPPYFDLGLEPSGLLEQSAQPVLRPANSPEPLILRRKAFIPLQGSAPVAAAPAVPGGSLAVGLEPGGIDAFTRTKRLFELGDPPAVEVNPREIEVPDLQAR